MSNLVLACPSCNLKKGTKNWHPRNKDLQEALIAGFSLGVLVFLLLVVLIGVIAAAA